MLFAQVNSQQKEFIIYSSLLESYKKNADSKINTFFSNIILQSKQLLNKDITFFDVASSTYNLIEYLTDECKDEINELEGDTLTPKNSEILLKCLSKK